MQQGPAGLRGGGALLFHCYCKSSFNTNTSFPGRAAQAPWCAPWAPPASRPHRGQQLVSRLPWESFLWVSHGPFSTPRRIDVVSLRAILSPCVLLVLL